jgi:hypothetical protein
MVAEAVADLLVDTGYELDGAWWDTTIQGNALAMASFG